MHVHTKGMDSLHEKISKTILPEEYGGEAGSISDLWSKSRFYMLSNRQPVKLHTYVFLALSRKNMEWRNRIL
jgi:hypothetical protein